MRKDARRLRLSLRHRYHSLSNAFVTRPSSQSKVRAPYLLVTTTLPPSFVIAMRAFDVPSFPDTSTRPPWPTIFVPAPAPSFTSQRLVDS